ncbi:MAG TPA: hypothetical protein DIW17_04750 [Clostridiales bacterium]|nr:hypothetical protein [Clostridiales bacterium]
MTIYIELILEVNYFEKNEMGKSDMKARTKLIITFMVIISIIFAYFLFRNQPLSELYPIRSAAPIEIDEKEELHFFSEGWIVCSSLSRFYNWDGTSMKPPFIQDDFKAENNEVHITAHTDHYIVTTNKRIYNTETVPFTLVYESEDFPIWDLKEYYDFLLLLLLDENEEVQPYILADNSNFLFSLNGMDDTKYVTSGSCDKELSLLTISVNAPVPMNRVFHYVNRNELYGMLSIDNQLIYNIYRLKNRVILIGIKDLMCYNMEGELMWSLTHDSGGQFEAITKAESLLLYFPEKSKLDENPGNTVFIDEKGYDVEIFPKYLTDIKPYGKGYIALESDHSIVVMNQQGKTGNKHRLQESVNRLSTNSYHPEILFVQTKDNILHLYTTEKQEEDTQ